jgi:predicted small lipoprotein YifL
MKKIFALVILAATLGSALSGCIVVPDDGYHAHEHYHDHDHY